MNTYAVIPQNPFLAAFTVIAATAFEALEQANVPVQGIWLVRKGHESTLC